MSGLFKRKAARTLGAIYIGNVVAGILFGVTSVQIYYYFSHYPNDKRHLKAAVATLWAIDFFHLFCICFGVYHYAVTNYVNPIALLSMSWSINLQQLVETANDVVIRLILIDRLWHLSNKNKYICGFLLACTTVVLGLGLFCFVIGFRYTTFEAFHGHAQWAFYMIMSVMIFSDIVIAASLCASLTRHRSEFKRTKSTINKIMWYTVHTTVLASVSKFICLILGLTKPMTFIYLGMLFVLPKVYLNCLLGLLNSRRKIRDTLHHGGIVSIPLAAGATSRTEHPFADNKNGNLQGKPIDIQVEIDRNTA